MAGLTHEGLAFVFLGVRRFTNFRSLSFFSLSVSPLSVSPVFPVSLSLALSPWSLASLPRLSSRVVCRRVVRSLASSRRLSSRVVCRLASSLCASSRCSVSVASCAESCRCQSRLVVRRPAAGVSRVVRSACESRPFFLSFQTRWMTFFFVLY